MYDRLLVPTDGSENAVAAAEHAITLAAETGASVHVLYVIDMRPHAGGDLLTQLTKALEADGQDAVAAIAAMAEEHDVPVETAVERGIPAQTILQYAREHDCDTIVMGTKGSTGLERALVGSVTEAVIRHADRPVLTVRNAGGD